MVWRQACQQQDIWRDKCSIETANCQKLADEASGLQARLNMVQAESTGHAAALQSSEDQRMALEHGRDLDQQKLHEIQVKFIVYFDVPSRFNCLTGLQG